MDETIDTTSFKDIIYENRNGAAWITINRPETYNSLLVSTIKEMSGAMLFAAEDPAIGVIVITGAGDKAFSSGGHVGALRDRHVEEGRNHLRRLAHLGITMRTCGKPIIAAVNGYCVGAGHELHVMCDLTIAVDHAKFGQTGPKIGSVPIWGATQMLHRMVGEKKAREILYLCRQYTAQEALQMGLINAVVSKEELYPTVQQWCDDILARSPEAIRIAKMSMNQESDGSLWPALFSSSEVFALHSGSPEFIEGTSAWIEKRKPNFAQFRVRKTKAK